MKASNELHWNNENFIKVSGEANCEPNGLNYVAEWETNELSKRKLSGAAHWFELVTSFSLHYTKNLYENIYSFFICGSGKLVDLKYILLL